jgi:hypothetical protein
MRKLYMLIVSLIFASLLLTGCLGGTSTKYVYDGSPTALEVVIKRDAVGPMALSALSDEPERYANVRIWKENSAGDVIYSVVRQIPIGEITGEGYTLSEELPSDKDYNVTAIYTGDGVFEVGEITTDAPANMMTTATLTIDPLDFVFHKPNEVYSGGTTGQFWVEFLELPNELEYIVYLATASWTANGKNTGGYLELPEGGSAWVAYTSAITKKAFPEVSTPTKLHYQLKIAGKTAHTTNVSYYPDLDYDNELPFVWLLPQP